MAKNVKQMPKDLFKRGESISKDMAYNIPFAVGKMARQEFAESFQMQRFNDDGTTTWKKPQRAISGTKAYNSATPAARTRKTLFGSGSANLRNSLEFKVPSPRRTTIGTDVPYARYHNEGTRPQPQRKFLGYSRRIIKEGFDIMNSFINKDMLK